MADCSVHCTLFCPGLVENFMCSYMVLVFIIDPFLLCPSSRRWWFGLVVMALVTSVRLLLCWTEIVLGWVTIHRYAMLVCYLPLSLLTSAGWGVSTVQGAMVVFCSWEGNHWLHVTSRLSLTLWYVHLWARFLCTELFHANMDDLLNTWLAKYYRLHQRYKFVRWIEL